MIDTDLREAGARAGQGGLVFSFPNHAPVP